MPELHDIDRDSLERCIAIASRDPDVARQLKSKLDGDHFCKPEPWDRVAKFAAFYCQIRALHLKLWQEPPCVADEDDLHERDKQAQTLLQKMLGAGLSRYEPDPIKALRKSTKKRK